MEITAILQIGEGLQMLKLGDELKMLGACREAVAWVGDMRLAEAWAVCERPDWMAWLVARVCEGDEVRAILGGVVEEAEAAAADAVNARHAASYVADAVYDFRYDNAVDSSYYDAGVEIACIVRRSVTADLLRQRIQSEVARLEI
jgi:hypothetical protein